MSKDRDQECTRRVLPETGHLEVVSSPVFPEDWELGSDLQNHLQL